MLPRPTLFLLLTVMDCTSRSLKVSTKKTNFSLKDSCILVTNYRNYHKCVIGRFSGCKSREIKRKAWISLHSDFLKDAPDVVDRSVDNVKDRIENIKSLARKYAAALKYHETGGGPPPTTPPAFVIEMYEIVHGETGDSLRGN